MVSPVPCSPRAWQWQPHSASRPSAVGIAAVPAHLSPALRSLDAAHGVELAAYARVSELSGMSPLPPGEGTLKASGMSLDLVLYCGAV